MKRRLHAIQLVLIYCLFALSCNEPTTNQLGKEKTKDQTTSDNRVIVSAPIVLKSFIKKNGEATGQMEMYLQRSIQDYYIKFCESNVSRSEIEAYLNEMDSLIKTVTVEVEFLNGSWDICDENELQQSRIGDYVTIHRLIK